MTTIKTKSAIELLDGEAHHMGEGVFVLTQRCEKNQPHSVVIQEADLRRLLETLS